MKTVGNLETLLTPYLARNNGRSAGTGIIGMLNIVQPRLYDMGPWRDTQKEISIDCSDGYVCLPMDYESILFAIVNNAPAPIQQMNYEYKERGPWIVQQPAANLYGIIDQGFVTTLLSIPTAGLGNLVFSSKTNATFSTSEIVTVTYTDTVDGYTQIALHLNTASTSITSAATYSSGAATSLTVSDSTGFYVGSGVLISGASDASYDGIWRVTAIPDGTHIAINKTFAAGAVTGTIATNRTLVPENAIESIESVVYTSLASRVQAVDSDGNVYLDIPAGSGVAQYRRYKVPQPPENPTETWTLQAIVKRAYLPVTSNNDLIYLDNINVLRPAFLAVIASDNGDADRGDRYWGEVRQALNDELTQNRGGARGYPQIDIWGRGISSPSNLYFNGYTF